MDGGAVNGGVLPTRVLALREAAGSARHRGLRLAAQADTMRWEGAAAMAFRAELAAGVAELLRIAAATERAADVLARHSRLLAAMEGRS